MALIEHELREHVTLLLTLLKGSWVVVETSSGYLMGQVKSIGLRNLNLVLLPCYVQVSENVMPTQVAIIRGSDVRKVYKCDDEEQCRRLFDRFRRSLL